ncbi:MAG TPA: thioredoxin family protein [Candidatus Saccharimonadales bacterium]|nr:thioredoxin family protein [Candidatus Saccharimonadales bacterium]
MKRLPAGGRLALPVLVLAVMLPVLGPSSAGAQTPGAAAGGPGSGSPVQENMPRSWYRNYEYGVEVDGKRDPDIGLFQIVGKPYMLIYGPDLKKGFVLSTRPNEVRVVDRSAITEKNDVEVVLAESSFMGVQPTPWGNDGPAAVVFYDGSRRIRVSRVPPLVGETTLDAIYEQNPMYKRGMEKYSPIQSAIARIKQVKTPYVIEVWFGSWCPHCLRIVPRFIKVMDAASNPNLQVVYHAVPHDFGTYAPAVSKDIQAIPTFIVMKGGREYKRFQGTGDEVTLEEELANVLTGTSARASGS